tara:strand:- start:484 stop:588 length:105 start_codon:yes stop_codon:yes gene_type:complete
LKEVIIVMEKLNIKLKRRTIKMRGILYTGIIKVN